MCTTQLTKAKRAKGKTATRGNIMPPRTTRAAKRRAREAAQEFKEQDPDPADVVEQQTRIRTPQKPRDTTEPLSGSFHLRWLRALRAHTRPFNTSPAASSNAMTAF